MLIIGAQLNADKPAREMSTAELIERIPSLSGNPIHIINTRRVISGNELK